MALVLFQPFIDKLSNIYVNKIHKKSLHYNLEVMERSHSKNGGGETVETFFHYGP